MVEKWELERMDRHTLVNNYERSVLDLVKEFVKVYFEDDTWTDTDVIDAAVGGEIDGVLNINDYYIDFSVIVYCIKNEVSTKEFFKWYDYTIEWSEFKHFINLDSWMRGAPRRSPEELEKFKGLQRKLNEITRTLEDEIQKANSVSNGRI